MTDITHIDDYRPHIQSVDPVTAVVMPVSLIEDMAAGRLQRFRSQVQLRCCC